MSVEIDCPSLYRDPHTCFRRGGEVDEERPESRHVARLDGETNGRLLGSLKVGSKLGVSLLDES